MQSNIKLVYPKENKKKIQNFFRKHAPVLFETLYNANLKMKDRRYFKEQDKIFDELLLKSQLPSHIEIETLNRCNSTCEFCPVNKNADTRELTKMKDEVFEKIIKDLQAVDYSGTLNLFSNNEPFLDKRIINFAIMAREHLPNAFIQIITNGTALNVKKVLDVLPHLSYLVINNYAFEMKLHSNVQEIYDEISANHPELAPKVNIGYRLLTEFKSTRAGNAPNRKKKKEAVPTFVSRCAYPFFQMVIRPDGRVSLCCNDALGQMTLGNVSDQNVIDVWQNKIRKNLQTKMLRGRDTIPLCKKCDNLAWAKPKRVSTLLK